MLTDEVRRMVCTESQKALERLDQALQIARVLGDKYRQARSLQNTAEAYGDLEERGKQLQFGGEALQLYQAIGDKVKEAEMLRIIGSTYNLLGAEEKAREYSERAPVAAQLGMPRLRIDSVQAHHQINIK